jgi:hypothetical protein
VREPLERLEEKQALNPHCQAHQLSVFFAPARYRVVKIMLSYSEVLLHTIKHTVIYHGLGPSLQLIALCQVV